MGTIDQPVPLLTPSPSNVSITQATLGMPVGPWPLDLRSAPMLPQPPMLPVSPVTPRSPWTSCAQSSSPMHRPPRTNSAELKVPKLDMGFNPVFDPQQRSHIGLSQSALSLPAAPGTPQLPLWPGFPRLPQLGAPALESLTHDQPNALP